MSPRATFEDRVNAESEAQAWEIVRDMAKLIRSMVVHPYGHGHGFKQPNHEDLGIIAGSAGRLEELAVRMQRQLGMNIHTNPPLVVYGNPPLQRRGRRIGGGSGSFRFVSLMSPNVHEVRYTHAEDGRDYRHPFERAEMWAIERGRGQRDVLLTGESGQPMWEDFD